MSITKVAKLAGVSSSTVSRVINNHPRVAPATVESVHNAMKKLGYTPSERRPGPKPLASRPPRVITIAFLVLGTSKRQTTPGFESLLRGVSQAASEHKLNLLFSHVTDPSHLPTRMATEEPDGLLLHGAPPEPPVLTRLRRLPTVWLMGNRQRPAWGDQVMPDAFEIGSLAARYLVRRGHKQLAFLNLDRGHWPFVLYEQSFIIVGSEMGAAVQAMAVQTPRSRDYWHEATPEAAEELVDQFLALPERPTGIFVADDRQVASIQPALRRRGVEIGPGATEIVSCNNEQPYLVGLAPKPAEIDIRTESVGRRGVEQLLWRLENRSVPDRVISLVEPVLVTSDEGAPSAAVA